MHQSGGAHQIDRGVLCEMFD